MDKMTCWDPRIEKDVETDNPALVLGGFMSRLLSDDEHWKRIGWLADYCDELVPAVAKKKRYMKSTCSDCQTIHRSPLVRTFLIGERVCSVHCHCGKDFDVFYNLTLKDGESNPNRDYEGISGRLEQDENGEYVVVSSNNEGKEE